MSSSSMEYVYFLTDNDESFVTQNHTNGVPPDI